MTNLNEKKWREFNFVEIFIIKGGFYNKKPPKDKNGRIPFIGATDSNNGVTEFYSLETIRNNSKTGSGKNAPIDEKIFEGNCICVTNDGSVGYAYYQENDFTCSHSVNPLYLRNYKLNKEIAMFLISAIEKQRVCFEYSRKWRPKRMKKSKILLPVKNEDDSIPDYDFMEKYIKENIQNKQIQYKQYITKTMSELNYKKVVPLERKEWKEFNIKELFPTIQRGKRLTKANQKKGNIPYVSSSANNNGVDNYISNNKKVRIFENCLSIANSGSVGASFYQPFEFIASDHVTHLKNEQMNKYIYLFIATLTNRLKDKYNFNREINDKRISKEKILLPINKQNEPDFEYMEQYIKNLMICKINSTTKTQKKDI